MTAPERPAPQEPTAQEHADTVRGIVFKTLRYTDGVFFTHEDYDSALDALDALLAEVERLTVERDEALAERAHAAEYNFGVEVDARRAAEALAELRGAAATLARSELDWCIGYASTVEHKAWRERLLKRLHVARAALAEDASHQDAGEPGYGGQQKGPNA